MLNDSTSGVEYIQFSDDRQARANVNATHAKKGVFENSNRILLNLLQLYTYPDAAVLYHFLKENYLSVPIDLVRF